MSQPRRTEVCAGSRYSSVRATLPSASSVTTTHECARNAPPGAVPVRIVCETQPSLVAFSATSTQARSGTARCSHATVRTVWSVVTSTSSKLCQVSAPSAHKARSASASFVRLAVAYFAAKASLSASVISESRRFIQ